MNQKITWDDLTINAEHLDVGELIEEWGWLIGKSVSPVLVTALGDVFYKDPNNAIFWLDTGTAKAVKVADTVATFKGMLEDNDKINEWFMPALVGSLKDEEMKLGEGQVFSYLQPPNLGGEYKADNFNPCDLSVHLSIHGQISEQIKDLPDGSDVKISLKN